MKKQNSVLKEITAQIYKQRPKMPSHLRTNYRLEHVNGGLLCDLWFLTSGCIHDRQGGCTMCNYGKSDSVIDQEQILRELRCIVKKLPFEFEDFLLTPSGSMLDPYEVPLNMRDEIVSILHDLKTKRFIIETRADTVTPNSLEFLSRILPKAKKYIEIGVESSNNWILKHCINKNSTYEEFLQAMSLIHSAGMFVTANIGLGAPFLSERAAIQDTITSVQRVLNDGVDSVVLFPYHIKSGTLLEIMNRNDMYHCVSLWALVEVLSAFSAEELQKIQISWYKDYFGAERSYILHSPTTCPSCRNEVIRLLDQYRDTQSATIASQLYNYACPCREAWQRQLKVQPESVNIEEVKRTYSELSKLFSLDAGFVDQELSVMEDELMRK